MTTHNERLYGPKKDWRQVGRNLDRRDLTTEYEGWLSANPNVPKLSADEALYQLIEPEPEKRTAAAKVQIDWLVDFIARWEKAEDR